MKKKILIGLLALLLGLMLAAQPAQPITALKSPISGGPTPILHGGPEPDQTLTPQPTIVTTPDTLQRERMRPGRFYWR